MSSRKTEFAACLAALCLPWILASCGESTAEASADPAPESAAAETPKSGLDFEKILSEHKVDHQIEVVEAKFDFTNNSAKPITIKSIDTNCKCLRAEPDKLTYAPGQSGVIEAAFEVEGLTGMVDKTLTVGTDHEEFPYYRLTVRIDIPLIIDVSPEMLTWAVGEDPKPKPLIVEVKQEKPIHITSIDVSRTNFTGEVKTIEEGKLYHVVLTPKSTEDVMIGVVSIETDCEIEAQRRQLGFYRIMTEKALQQEAEEEAEEQ